MACCKSANPAAFPMPRARLRGGGDTNSAPSLGSESCAAEAPPPFAAPTGQGSRAEAVRTPGRAAFPLFGIQGLPMSTGRARPSPVPPRAFAPLGARPAGAPRRAARRCGNCAGAGGLVAAMLAAAATGSVEELERLVASAAEAGGCSAAAVTAMSDPVWFDDAPLHYAALQGQVRLQSRVIRYGVIT
jgi:hypothetical protein